MRMIDADALDKMLADAQTECKRNGGNFRVGILSNVRENIAYVPTIDAIPVEWLREKMREPQMREGNPFGFVLAEWLEEQGVREWQSFRK